MSGSSTTVPLANLAETDIDLGIDDGFAGEGGVDDGLAEGNGGNNGGVPAIEPRVAGGRTPSPGMAGGEGGRRRGYFPVHNPSSKPVVPHGKGNVPLDVNLYATKKTVAQGMMDLALLTANANQLRYVLESGVMGGYYYNFNIVLISASIIFQVVIGIALIFLGRYNVTQETQARKVLINPQQMAMLEQLRREASWARMPVSESVGQIKAYVTQHQQEDYLLIGFSSQKANPYREKSSCDIL